MAKTSIIIFSKNRTLQLKSLLLSLRHYSDVPEDCITIIYKADEGISYERLERQFNCKFIRQGDFLEDIKKIVRGSSSDYIGFMVDDLIFREAFSLASVERLLDANPKLDSFCLRLGRNITDKGPQPDFVSEKDGIIEWNTQKGLGKHWNYFWELSSSIYRRGHVLAYLSKCRPQRETFPNPLEYHYYACMPNTRTSGLLGLYLRIRHPLLQRSMRVACFESSKCFTHGVNLVAELDDKDRQESHSYKDLHQKMLDGWIVDFISPVDIKSPNPGGQLFKLVKEKK